MAEVSEVPEEPKQSSPEPTEQLEQSSQAETTQEHRKDLVELDLILEELSSLLVLCEETLTACKSLKHQETVQRQLKSYASGLVGVATCLQHLNDFRRLIPSVVERAQTTRTALITARGGEEDALVSEEARVLSAVEQTKETIVQSIGALEGVLSGARQSTPALLSVISFTSPGFSDYASQALGAIRVDFVANAVFSERERIRNLRQDVHDVYVLLEHAHSLQ